MQWTPTSDPLAALFEIQGLVQREAVATPLRPPNRKVVQFLRNSFETMAIKVLGFNFKPQADETTQKLLTHVVGILLQQREAARKARDYKITDAIREQLQNAGISVEDTAQGPVWRREHKVLYRL